MTFREFFYNRSVKGRWSSWWAMYMTFPLILGLAFGIWNSVRDSCIASRQLITTGIVTAYTPDSHDECFYSFSVQGKSFEGQDFAPHHPLAPHEVVTVFYDSTDPKVSGLEDYSTRGNWEGGLTPVFVFGILIISTIILVNKIRNASRQR
jgi:hypothetical protein